MFCGVGRSCPAHIAQPIGAKLNPNSLISPMNGSDKVASLFSF